MDDQKLWKLMRDASRNLQERYDPAIQPLVSNSKLNLREWMLILAALTFEPEDTTASHLLVRGPYTSIDKYLSGLEKATAVGYMEKVMEGRFRLSDHGRKGVQEFIDVARQAMIETANLPEDELAELAQLFERLVNNCLAVSPPPDKWSIKLSLKLMPGIDSPMPYIEQAISCLTAYRDDAHLASWCASGLSASALESLTLIWHNKVNSFQEIIQELRFRGHPDSVYLDALAELNSSGYLTGSRNNLILTQEGEQFRIQVENQTDEYFFQPWVCLSDDEKRHMAEILPKI